MYHLRRLVIFAICLAVFIVAASVLPRVLNPTPPSPEERRRDREWVDTSPYWVDRQACRWLSLCGLHHLRRDPPALPAADNSGRRDGDDQRRLELRSPWGPRPAEAWETAGKATREQKRRNAQRERPELEEIPEFVLAHAPLVHLYSGEYFWPSDIAEHIQYMTPFANDTVLNTTLPLSLDRLHELDNRALDVFLTSDDDVEDRPDWLHSRYGIPLEFVDDDAEAKKQAYGKGGGPPLRDGTTWFDVDKDHPLRRISDPRRVHGKGRGLITGRAQRRNARQRPVDGTFGSITNKTEDDGLSKAPAVLVMVDKGSDILDAFWFFFYSYNLGQTVLGVRYGNHVGDWEHCMVRFESGVPRAMFLSEHEGGQAYAWEALEKRRVPGRGGLPGTERPVIYSAVGSHAMYALPGVHPYVLPFKMLRDVTDEGPLWDPARNNYAYFFDYLLDREESRSGESEPASLTPAASNPDAATSWFHFAGSWGDKLLALRDKRQWRLFGQYHYVTGPRGPKFKHLDRHKVCQTEKCRILYSLDAGKKGTWYS